MPKPEFAPTPDPPSSEVALQRETLEELTKLRASNDALVAEQRARTARKQTADAIIFAIIVIVVLVGIITGSISAGSHHR